MSRDLSFKTFVSETGRVNSEDQMGVFSVPGTVLGTFFLYLLIIFTKILQVRDC